MEKLISKELLSEVLKVKIRKINSSILDGNLYYYKELVKCKSKINIYELAHKCKEWAENQGYILLSKNKECLVYLIDDVYDVIECLNQYEDYFDADTEYEAIFKACDRILDNEVKYER